MDDPAAARNFRQRGWGRGLPLLSIVKAVTQIFHFVGVPTGTISEALLDIFNKSIGLLRAMGGAAGDLNGRPRSGMYFPRLREHTTMVAKGG